MVLDKLSSQLASINPALAIEMQSNPWVLPLFVSNILMKIIFYPIALYMAARRQEKGWFAVLFIGFFVLNDLGALAIFYILFKIEPKAKPQVLRSKKKKL